MGWVVGGFVMAVVIELIIRVLSGYKTEEKSERRRKAHAR